jgi:hypothetical protein
MKKLFFIRLLIICSALLIGKSFNQQCYSQVRSTARQRDNYYSIISGSNNNSAKRIELKSDIDTGWVKWKERGYNYGFNPSLTPMYSTVNGILSTPYMIQVRGNSDEKNKKRWGYHVFEGYATDDKSRITMLVNKHVEEEKPVAEIYYYGTEYNHSEKAYNWFRIGSDVKQHSFLFSRDRAIFYGSLKLNNVLTLGNIGKGDLLETKPSGDDEANSEKDSRFVNFNELKNCSDGSLFYDRDNKMVVIKLDGKWMKMVVEPLPDSVSYVFDR